MSDEKTTDLINIDNDLIDSDVQDTIQAIMTVKKPNKKDEKWIRFHLLRMFGIPTQTASSLAGFSPDYGYKLLKKYRNNTKHAHKLARFIDSMPDDYRMLCRARLPLVAEIEGDALIKYKEKPELAIRQPALLRQIKQGAGVDLTEPTQPVKQTINIKEFRQNYWAPIIKDFEKSKAIEGKVVDNEK